MSEVASGRGRDEEGVGGGLSWADPDLWQVWNAYRNRQGQPEPVQLRPEVSEFEGRIN